MDYLLAIPLSLLRGAYESVSTAPPYHIAFEAFLLVCIVWLIFRKSYRPAGHHHQLTEQQKDEIIAEWQPEPLVPDSGFELVEPKYVDGKIGKYLTVEGKQYLNVSTFNFLGFIGDERIEERAKETIFKYGVGSCGPRGFYGTIDVHLDLEQQFAEFMGCEEAVLYSYGFATIASSIPAYAKRGDVIFCDKAANFAIQKGCQASRSRVEYFKHNDVADLERLLELQAKKDAQNPKKAKVTGRFLILEGIYVNSGELCPLPEMLRLKWKYKVRIFLDESYSFGVLGATGRGLTEHFGVDVEDIDMVCVSLENSLAATGGVCVGRHFVINHQRLSGLGYCFSASLPPFLAVAASEAIKLMQAEPERFDRLRHNCDSLRRQLKAVFERAPDFAVEGSAGSPLLHIKWRPVGHYDADAATRQARVLDRLVDFAFDNGIAMTRARYLINDEKFPLDPSIRLAVNADLSTTEIENIVDVVTRFVAQLD